MTSDENLDLNSALANNGVGFGMADIAAVLLELTGENDGAEWHWIVKLAPASPAPNCFVYLHGGCDFTGWDCQSRLDCHVADPGVTLEKALELCPLEVKAAFETMWVAGIATAQNRT